MSYLLWGDFDKKKSTAEKITEGADHYFFKHQARADVCLCNVADAGDIEQVDTVLGAVAVTGVTYIRPGQFWIGEAAKNGGPVNREAQQSEMLIALTTP